MHHDALISPSCLGVLFLSPRSTPLPPPLYTALPTQEHGSDDDEEIMLRPRAYVVAADLQARQDTLWRAAAEVDKCLVCLEAPRTPVTRGSCGHFFCGACVMELRAKGVFETCPLCISPLPPGPEKFNELGSRVWAKLNCAVKVAANFDGTWRKLSASQQREMDGAIVMLQEATDHVSGVVMLTPNLAFRPTLSHNGTSLPPGPHQSSGASWPHLLLGARRAG